MQTSEVKPIENKIKVPVKRRSASFADPLKYKIVGDKEIEFSTQAAFEFLELKTFDGERPVRESHVQFLFDEYVSGRFLWQNIMLASAKLDGQEFRINGQHTCWMRVNIDEKRDPKPIVRRMTYAVADTTQLRALYSAFDRNAARSPGHISRVILMDTAAGADLPHSFLTKLVPGFRIWFSPDWRANKQSIPDLCAMIDKNYALLFNTVGRFFQLHYSDNIFIKRAAVIGALFASFEKSVKAADEFWTAVSTGLDLTNKTDPRYQCRRFLETHFHKVARGKDVIGQDEMYNTCVHLWNTWREGGSIANVKPVKIRPKARA